MTGYIYDTSVLSALLDAAHQRHVDIARAVASLPDDASHFVSAVSLAELTFGVRMSEAFSSSRLPALEQMLIDVHTYGVLEIGHHTATAYAELKTNLARRYLLKANRRDRPRWVEEWPLNNRGQRLQVDENDLWLCAQAKERSLTLLTADGGIQRIADADPEVMVLLA
ncbi:putative nucleic acid-binding protein [Sphingobium xenophagum]|uniref:Nucleic acid-binding protein n=1 Tax=Sphingobium xenophagum TaxID=121428 RepID=A0ABU1X2F3_SPHXE|nr:PIN domain-containing protein [Sphingobium xenophagum]MDR7155755.1 putative nucleic acid-binding protein [Sphingobium xenophagum]